MLLTFAYKYVMIREDMKKVAQSGLLLLPRPVSVVFCGKDTRGVSYGGEIYAENLSKNIGMFDGHGMAYHHAVGR